MSADREPRHQEPLYSEAYFNAAQERGRDLVDRLMDPFSLSLSPAQVDVALDILAACLTRKYGIGRVDWRVLRDNDIEMVHAHDFNFETIAAAQEHLVRRYRQYITPWYDLRDLHDRPSHRQAREHGSGIFKESRIDLGGE